MTRGVTLTEQCVLFMTLAVVLGFASAVTVGGELLTLADAVTHGSLSAEGTREALHLAVFHVAVVAVGFTGALAFVLAHVSGAFTAAMRNLTQRVESIGQGAFAERVPLEGPPEVRRLASAVNAMAESLAWREQRLLHAERLSSVGTLVAGVAHEIGNPLGWLRANAELALMEAEDRLAEPDVPASERAFLERSLEAQRMNLDAVDRLSGITNALKDVSRAPRKDRRAQDVNAIVDGCLVIAHQKLMHGVTVEKDLAATSRVLGDGAEISQVLLNLVLNAADAVAGDADAPAGVITIRSRDDADAVVITVTDSGPGIPEDFRARLFEPFATTKPHGTGLGLAIAHRIVTAHGGSLACESPPGEGATFIVRLPAAAAAAAADA